MDNDICLAPKIFPRLAAEDDHLGQQAEPMAGSNASIIGDDARGHPSDSLGGVQIIGSEVND